MTILQVISSCGFYGAESMLLSLAEGLERLGSSVKVAVFRDARDPHTELADIASRKGVKCAVVPCNSRWDVSAIGNLRSLIHRFEADIVHAHGYKADLYSLAAAWPLRKPLFSTCHNWPDRSLGMRAYAVADRWALRFFDHVTAPSPRVEATLLRSGIAKHRVSYVRNGVDVGAFAAAKPVFRVEQGFTENPLIGFVGRLTAAKGGDVLIRAARQVLRRFPDARFVFAGEGPQLGDWKALVGGLGVADQVIFLGSREDMPSIYASLDMLVLPSFDEAMPMCLLEAMAAGIPVIATPVGAVPEVIRHDETGLLVAPGDAEALAHAVLRILDDRTLSSSIGIHARASVTADYSSDAMARRYLSLYDTVIARRRISQPAGRDQEAST